MTYLTKFRHLAANTARTVSAHTTAAGAETAAITLAAKHPEYIAYVETSKNTYGVYAD